MKPVYVLGNGQLGHMLYQAGLHLGIDVTLLPLQGAQEPIPDDARLTAEIEHWPPSPIVAACRQHAHFINQETILKIADRAQQKQLLDTLQLPTSPWCLLEKKQIRYPSTDLIVKRRKGGYDGRGQWQLTASELDALPDEIWGQAIAEARVNFDTERSVIGARNVHGDVVFYPCGENFHQHGMLYASWVDVHRLDTCDEHAQTLLARLLEATSYVGVMAMEYFVCGSDIIINELAPRVHNSGHWTQTGASISQFEMHLRALIDWPLAPVTQFDSTVMINLVGVERNPQWLAVPGVQLHWYGKDVREGRKVGHINLCGTYAQLQQSVYALSCLLPATYRDVWSWLDGRIGVK